ncbi:hypothetical protein WDW37_11905 [Bdellovibrionota bacterium FG-1]
MENNIQSPVTSKKEKRKEKPQLTLVETEHAIEVAGVPFLRLFVDQFSESHAAYLSRDGHPGVAPIRSQLCRSYIRQYLYEQAGLLLTKKHLEEIVEIVEGFALVRNDKIDLCIRVARDNADILVNGMPLIYRISPGVWTEDSSGILKFRTPSTAKALARPIEGGDPKKVFNFVNIEDEDEKLLLLVYLVASFVPDIPHPILAIHGPQGSGKSSLLRFLTRIIDPNTAEEVHLHGEVEFVQSASERWVVGIDNVTNISDRISDLLCKFVTGVSFTKRKLYTDNDQFVRSFKRVVILNGIGLPMRKPDILDRTIIIGLSRIKSDMRKSESSLEEQFENVRGEVVGGLFDLLAKALAILPTLGKTPLPRLADFGNWGRAIAVAAGYSEKDFVRAYSKNIQRQVEEALEASPLATVIQYYLDPERERYGKDNRLEGTPTHVLRELKNIAPQAGIEERVLPKSARGLGRGLMEVKATLEEYGYVVERSRGKDRRIQILPPKPTT